MKRFFFLYLSSTIIQTRGCVIPLSSRQVFYAFYHTTLPNTTISTQISTTIPTSTAINSAPRAHNLIHPQPLPPPLLTLRNSQFAEHLFFTVTYLIIYTYITPQMYFAQRPTINHFHFDCNEHLLSENDVAKSLQNISSHTHTYPHTHTYTTVTTSTSDLLFTVVNNERLDWDTKRQDASLRVFELIHSAFDCGRR